MIKKILFISLLVLFTAIWGGWLIAVPEDIIVEKLETSLSRGGFEIETVNFKKGIFYNFTMDGLDIKRSGLRVLSADNISGRLDLASLLRLQAAVNFEGTAGGGTFKGTANIRKGGQSIVIDIWEADLEKTGIYEATGVKAGGLLSGNIDMKGSTGEIKFSVTALKLEPVKVKGTMVPLDMFDTMRGALYIKGNNIEIHSLALEGKGIYARVTGDIKGATLDAKLELMPEESVMPDMLLSAVLGRYRVSRGHYAIPIRKKLRL